MSTMLFISILIFFLSPIPYHFYKCKWHIPGNFFRLQYKTLESMVDVCQFLRPVLSKINIIVVMETHPFWKDILIPKIQLWKKKDYEAVK
jgi:hypothetical protein